MAIAFDVASDGGIATTGTITWSHTCTGSNRFLVVLTRGDSVSSVTYDGVTMINADSIAAPNGNLRMWYLSNPSSGANNVVVTLSGSAQRVACSASYTGVSVDGQPDATNTNTATSTTISTSVTTIRDNCWTVLGLGAEPSKVLTAGSGSTLRADNDNNGAIALFDSNAAKTPPGSTTMVGDSDTSSDLATVIMSFRPKPKGGVFAFML